MPHGEIDTDFKCQWCGASIGKFDQDTAVLKNKEFDEQKRDAQAQHKCTGKPNTPAL